MTTASMTPDTGVKARVTTGRSVGALLLAHMALALILPFVIVDNIRGSEGLLANAAAHANWMRIAVLIFFAGNALGIGVAIAASKTIRRHSTAMATWLVALAVAAFSLQAVDNGALLSLLSLSQEYAKTGTAKAEVFEAAGLVANAARKWAHFTFLLVIVSWMALLYGVWLRLALVPRLLAALGLLACLLQIVGVTGRVIFGYPPIMELAMPLAPIHVTTAVWLMVKGFDERRAIAAA